MSMIPALPVQKKNWIEKHIMGWSPQSLNLNIIKAVGIMLTEKWTKGRNSQSRALNVLQKAHKLELFKLFLQVQ